MKKSLLAVSACLMVMGISSCSETKDSTSTISYGAYYHVSQASGTDAPVISSGLMNFEYNNTQGTASATIGPFGYGPNLTATLGFSGVPFGYNGVATTLQSVTGVRADNGMAVSDFSIYISGFYRPAVSSTLSELNWKDPVNGGAIVMSCNLGSYKVRTFWPDAVFRGKTETQFPTQDGTGSYTSTSISYRIIMDLSVDPNTGIAKNKANLVIYNAKFAEEQPFTISIMMLRDLDVSFDASGYTVYGKDVIPQVVDESGLTPYQPFIFNEVTFTSTGDLSTVNGSFDVAGRYHGDFRGVWAFTDANVKEFSYLFSDN